MNDRRRIYNSILETHLETHRQMAFVSGPRQVGKTTPARALVGKSGRAVYLDMERPSDAARLSDAESYLEPLALFIILGCFLDGISMVVLTASVILPSVKAAGIDLLWFGIFVVLVVEMAQITPPVGFNLFVLQGLTGKNMFYVAKAALPFFVLMAVAVALIWVFPEIVHYLPGKMFKPA